jgi:hypothetical protein
VSVLQDGGGESTELHERAHLLHAAARPQVNALLARLGEPREGSYASTDPGEHFAEMASEAWDIMMPADSTCWALDTAARLQQAESDVPGTAGFVAYYLRSGLPAPGRDTLLAVADSLIAGDRTQWEQLWREVEFRRHADASLRPFERLSIAASIRDDIARLRESGKPWYRFYALLLQPSLLLASALQ